MIRFVLCGSAWLAAWHLAPAVTLTAAAVYAVLLAWPDRALGWTLAAACVVPAWALRFWSDTSGPAWLWFERGDWTSAAGAVTAATVGPLAGAVAWLASRRYPEGAELHRRQHAEDARKGWVRAAVAAALPSSRRGRGGSAGGVAAVAAAGGEEAWAGNESRQGDSQPMPVAQPSADPGGSPAALAPRPAGAVAYGPRRPKEGSRS